MAKIICIATPLYAPQIGGPATHVALLERELPKNEFELRIVKFSNVAHLPKIIRHVAYFFLILKEAKGADVVYALDPVSVGLPALCAAKFRGVPLVLRIGGDYAWEQGVQRFGVTETLDEFVAHNQPSVSVSMLQGIQTYVARHARYVVLPSEYLAGIVRTWGIPMERIRVVYSQPELHASPSRSNARKQLTIHEDEEVVLSAGRLVPWKGFEGLIDAVAEVRRERPLQLYIAGDGPQKSAIEAHIQKKEAGEFVTLLGTVSNKNLRVWIAAADIFALNTRYEGLSHVLLEAFNARTPVVTTPVGGNHELVEDGATGLFVTYNDVPMLASALLRLCKNRELALSLADKAHQSLSRFSTPKALEALIPILKLQ